MLAIGQILRRSAAALGRTAIVAVASGALMFAQQSDEEPQANPAPPYALFQYATLTGSGNTINGTWVPVVTSSGQVVYKHIVLRFNVGALGGLALASGYPQVLPSPPQLASSFRTGKYVGPSNIYSGLMAIVVSGPAVTQGGATEWSLTTPTGASPYTYPSTAVWYDGPPAGSPLALRLKNVGLDTSTFWKFGIGGTQFSGYWSNNSLLGFSQIGNQLNIVSFTDSSGDHSQPVATPVVYTLQP